MDELKKYREELEQLGRLLTSLNYFSLQLPRGVFVEDVDSFIDGIKYLKGYVDCMIKFGVELPESDD